MRILRAGPTRSPMGPPQRISEKAMNEKQWRPAIAAFRIDYCDRLAASSLKLSPGSFCPATGM